MFRLSTAILQSSRLLQNKNDNAKFGTEWKYFAYKIAKQFHRSSFDTKEYFFMITKHEKKSREKEKCRENVFSTISNFLIPIFLQPKIEDHRYVKLQILLDQIV